MNYQPPVKSSVKKLHDRRFAGRDPLSSSSSRSSSYSMGPSSSSRSSPSSKAAHAAAYAPSNNNVDVSSFERRMRNLVLGNRRTEASSSQQQKQTSRSPPQYLPPNVMKVETLQDYKKIVCDEKQRMVAVRFYATWCKACQAVAPMFYKLATTHPDTLFVDVPVTSHNSNLHQGLGVPSLPFGHLYHPVMGLVEETKLTRKQVTAFGKTLDTYINGYCELPDELEDELNE